MSRIHAFNAGIVYETAYPEDLIILLGRVGGSGNLPPKFDTNIAPIDDTPHS